MPPYKYAITGTSLRHINIKRVIVLSWCLFIFFFGCLVFFIGQVSMGTHTLSGTRDYGILQHRRDCVYVHDFQVLPGDWNSFYTVIVRRVHWGFSCCFFHLFVHRLCPGLDTTCSWDPVAEGAISPWLNTEQWVGTAMVLKKGTFV